MCDQQDALSTVGMKGLTVDIVEKCDSALLPGTVLTTFTASDPTACPSSHPSQEITCILWNHSQQPATCSYRKPHASCSHSTILFLYAAF
jgi:hypothetical protein